jgi:hypothetical protein
VRRTSAAVATLQGPGGDHATRSERLRLRPISAVNRIECSLYDIVSVIRCDRNAHKNDYVNHFLMDIQDLASVICLA